MYLYTNFEGPTGAALTTRDPGIGDIEEEGAEVVLM